MAVSKRLRHEVMRRDGHACRYCGATAPDVKLTIDHVTPTTLGGTDEPSNLVTACADCNAGKSATPPDAALVADVNERAVRWNQAMEVAISRRQDELHQMRARTDAFDQAWNEWGAIPREVNWRGSIARFLASGLNDQFLLDAIEIAMGNRTVRTNAAWKYFCGICWTEIKKVQTLAGAIVNDAPDAEVVHLDSRRRYGKFDDFLPDHRVVIEQHPDFPSVSLAGKFITDLLWQTSAPDGVDERVQRLLWESMAAAYAEFIESVDRDDSSEGISEAWRVAEERMQSVAAGRWGEIAALCRGTWDGRPGDTRMPQGAGLHPGFDALNLTDRYIADIFDHLGIYDQRAAWAHRGYWAAMEDSYRAFIAGEMGDAASEDDLVAEQFDMSSAYFLNEVWIASGRPTRQRRVVDGEVDA